MNKLEIISVKKAAKKKRIYLKDCQKGDVIKFADGVIGLVCDSDGVEQDRVQHTKTIFLLAYSDGQRWCEITNGQYCGTQSEDEPIICILGKISKIEYE